MKPAASWAVALLAFASIATPALSQTIITQCGAQHGFAYTLEPKASGWIEDGISGGYTLLIRNPGGSWDILFKDAMRTTSATDDGATVLGRQTDPRHFTLLALYPTGTVETYGISGDTEGNTTLIHTSARNGVGAIGFTSASVFISKCSKMSAVPVE
jgi:hypothetical protein